jgi:hypothetical protein
MIHVMPILEHMLQYNRAVSNYSSTSCCVHKVIKQADIQQRLRNQVIEEIPQWQIHIK